MKIAKYMLNATFRSLLPEKFMLRSVVFDQHAAAFPFFFNMQEACEATGGVSFYLRVYQLICLLVYSMFRTGSFSGSKSLVNGGRFLWAEVPLALLLKSFIRGQSCGDFCYVRNFSVRSESLGRNSWSLWRVNWRSLARQEFQMVSSLHLVGLLGKWPCHFFIFWKFKFGCLSLLISCFFLAFQSIYSLKNFKSE